MQEKEKRGLIGLAAWAVIGFFLIAGIQQTLGAFVAGLAGFAYVFAIGWFLEHAPEWFS